MQAERAAESAENSATKAWWAFGFAFLSFLPLWIWWPLLIIFLLWDVISLCGRIGKGLDSDDELQVVGSIFFLLLGVLGLHLFGVWNVLEWAANNGRMLIMIGLIQIGSAAVFLILKGSWDIYFLYYKEKKRKLYELLAEVTETTINRMRDQHEKARPPHELKARAVATGEPVWQEFDPNGANVRAAIANEWEMSRERKDLLRGLKVSAHIGRYIFISLFWEAYVLWKVIFQFVERFKEVFMHLGQAVADLYHRRLQSIGPAGVAPAKK